MIRILRTQEPLSQAVQCRIHAIVTSKSNSVTTVHAATVAVRYVASELLKAR
jgi:hypothetical protein